VHLGDPGYFAFAPVDRDLVNINFVLDAEALRAAGGDAKGFYLAHLARNPRLARRMRRAELVGPVRATGPMARRCRSVVAPGALLVGDAAEFVDPVTGEGIFCALRSAEIAAACVARAFRGRAPMAPLLEDFRDARAREFEERLRGCRRVQRFLHSPWIVNRVVRTLGARPELADRVIGMSGDYIPPSEVFNLMFVLRFLNPFRRRRGPVGVDEVPAAV
jgi:flavin-dependent dehydrogenase